jgi:chromosome segregation ATPase
VLYLAEVQRKKGVIGSGRPELKLLACQRSESSWSAVSGDEVVPAPDDANYAAGVLVMAELSNNRQVQRITEAGRQLVSILQNFSRMQDKFKTQEEEIEQWKQSLTYQSQELNRREMEMEAREEQLQLMEEDFEKLEQQRQELDSTREDVQQLQEDYERKNQELEGAWAQLRGEMAKLEEQQAHMSQAMGLDDDKAQQMQELLDRLSGAIAPTEAVREQVNYSFDIISQQQGAVESHHHQVEEQRRMAQELETAMDQQMQRLDTCWNEWKQAQTALDQSKAGLQGQQQALHLKQEYIDSIAHQIKTQDQLFKQFCQLAENSDGFTLGGKVDLEALDAMSIEALETTVKDMQADLEKMSRFVNSQEEELTAQQDTINQLQSQIQSASEYDRLRIESEMADEQDRFCMLDETLVGQRRNLQERREVLKQHQGVLDRRKGNVTDETPAVAVDLSPVINQLEAVKQELAEKLHAAQTELQNLQTAVEQSQQSLTQELEAQSARWDEIQQLEQDLKAQKASVGELWGKINAYQETLELNQGGVDGLKQKLEAIASVIGQFQEVSDYQLQAITEMRQMISTLTQSQTPEFVAS